MPRQKLTRKPPRREGKLGHTQSADRRTRNTSREGVEKTTQRSSGTPVSRKTNWKVNSRVRYENNGPFKLLLFQL
jgi:hypothetical protein